MVLCKMAAKRKIRTFAHIYKKERTGLVSQLVFKTNSRRIIPAVAGSIPALSARKACK